LSPKRSEWKTVPIKELYAGLYDGPHATPKPADDGPVFLGIKNVTDDGRLDLSDIRHIAEDDYAAWTRRIEPAAGDIVFTYEATLNRYAIIPEGFRGCLGRRMALIRPNPEKMDTRFLHFYFFTEPWRQVIATNTLSGATVDRIPLTNFPDFPVNVPPLEVQRQIAAILSAYDDLIGNNLRRIKILEEMARAIFREWFVIEGKTRKGQLGEICNAFKDRFDDTLHGDLPLLDLAHLPSRSLAPWEAGHPSELTTSRITFTQGDTLFGAIRCYLHKVVLAPYPGVTNVSVLVLRPKSHWLRSLLAIVASSTETIRWADQHSSGTKMPVINWDVLKALPLPVPDEQAALRFEKIVAPMLQSMGELSLMNANLRRTRDMVLPRLLSGEGY